MIQDDDYADRIFPASTLEPLMAPLRHAGISPVRALQAAGLRERDVLAPDTLVSIDQMVAVYQAVIAEPFDPMLAYRLGLAFHVTTYGMYGFAVLSTAYAAQALEVALQYHRLGSPLARPTLLVGEPSARWKFTVIPHPRIVGALYEFLSRLHLAIFAALYSEVIDDDLSGMRAGLAFDLAPDEAAVVEQLMGLKVERVRGRDSWIRLDSGRLSRPTRMGSPAVNRMLLAICDEQIEELRKRKGVAGQLRTILIANSCRPLSATVAANRMGTTERSLARRLAAEGTSFRAVLDDVRLQAAIGYLRDTELTVEVIADVMGFSDAANFRRAFRRWTGDAPRHYRSRLRRLGRATGPARTLPLPGSRLSLIGRN
jgi:AraC-like DNA-binding protein